MTNYAEATDRLRDLIVDDFATSNRIQCFWMMSKYNRTNQLTWMACQVEWTGTTQTTISQVTETESGLLLAQFSAQASTGPDQLMVYADLLKKHVFGWDAVIGDSATLEIQSGGIDGSFEDQGRNVVNMSWPLQLQAVH